MRTSRRGFFAAIAAAVAGATLDPERLLWMPGRKVISIPKPGVRLLTAQEITNEMLQLLSNQSVIIHGNWRSFEYKIGQTVNVRMPQRFRV